MDTPSITDPVPTKTESIVNLAAENQTAWNRVEELDRELRGWRAQIKVMSRDIDDLRQKNAVIKKDAEMAWERVAELERREAKLLAVMPPSSVPCPTPPPKPYDMDTWEYGYGGKVMRVFTPSELDPVLYEVLKRYVMHVMSPYQCPEVKPRGVGMADPEGMVQP
jgi:hypothetical protein